jgi:hypothetical protein
MRVHFVAIGGAGMQYLAVVIPGMHARPDNPELIRSVEPGIKIVSFPFIF